MLLVRCEEMMPGNREFPPYRTPTEKVPGVDGSLQWDVDEVAGETYRLAIMLGSTQASGDANQRRILITR